MMRTRLGLFYGALFLAIGIYLPYWPLWLEGKGLNPTEIGALMALGIAGRAVINPLVAQWADRSGRRRQWIIWLLIGALVVVLPFHWAEGVWLLAGLTLAHYGLTGPVMPLAESLTMRLVQDRGLDYGHIRLWGSVSFIGAALLGGMVVAEAGAGSVYLMMVLAVAISALAAPLLPDVRIEGPPNRRSPLFEVLSDRRFVIFLLGCAALQGSHGVYYAFGSIHWRNEGLSEALIGVYWAEGVVAEILLFLIGARLLRRYGSLGLLILAGVVGVIRWIALGLTVDPALIAMAQAGHAFTYGAAHLGAMHHVQGHIAPGLSATAQSLYSVIVMGLGTGLTILLAGPLFEGLGGGSYHVMAITSALGLLTMVWLRFGGVRKTNPS
ncbi:MAG: MFS transporter [Magnetovibrionaceae bacterium]